MLDCVSDTSCFEFDFFPRYFEVCCQEWTQLISSVRRDTAASTSSGGCCLGLVPREKTGAGSLSSSGSGRKSSV